MVVTGSIWQLQGLCGNYRVYVAVQCGSNRVYVAVPQCLCGSTGSMWQALNLCGSNRVYVAVTGSMWQ